MNAWESLAGNYIWKQFQPLKYDWMMSRSTGRLAESDSNYGVNAYEVRAEGSRLTTGPLDNVGSLLVKIIV